MPEYLMQGITYLIPKGKKTTAPSKYRLIACLCTLYKIITACIADKVYKHCEKLLADEQRMPEETPWMQRATDRRWSDYGAGIQEKT